MNFKLTLSAVATAASVFLAGCGGGGDDTPTTATAKLEGAYEGTTSAGQYFGALVLENNDAWALYGTQSGGTLYVYGLVRATNGTANGSTYSASVKDYPYTGQVYSGSMSVNHASGTSFTGTVATTAQVRSISASSVPASSFNYNTPANVAAIAGAWSGTTVGGEAGTIAVNASGAFTGSIGGCSMSGQFTPRPSGKNVLNATVTFGAAPCLYPNTTVNGNGVNYAITGGSQLIMFGTSPSGDAGTAFIARR